MTLLHQATCIAINGRALMIEGPPGSGKSRLALALIDRGAVLVGDDGVSLEERSGRLYASPAPATSGLLEVRNLGLLTFPTISNTRLALVLRLDPEAPRFIDAAEQIDLHRVILPLVRMWPDPDPLKAELALKRYGV
ncbi:MAG: HPr kinase/phosphatase C-terminal domain-containing protein [Novosphingobium sp.]|uniref:HPr kinase/phosphorylase n=1 Tax=Novosphingobium sp. TaxID=1874826 RepID=UPI003C7AE8C2